MKIVLLALFTTALLITTGFAGDYYGSRELNKYSNDGEVYYRGISFKDSDDGFFTSKSSVSWVMNLQVFDLKNGKSWKIFEDDFSKDFSITELIFESTQEDNGYLSVSGNHRLKNGFNSKKAKEKVLIVVRNSKMETDTLWTANKLGKELVKVATVGEHQDWHIDVKNEKIRVFTKEYNLYRMEEYPW